jgi:hypothetical protein
MAATAGTLKAVGASGRTYLVDLYVPDAVSTSITFNPSGLAGTGSDASWRCPENLVITEISLAGSPTAVGAVLKANGASINGGTFRHANVLATLATRQTFALPIRGGDFISATQY